MRATEGQLVSFSLFKAKDPFVPGVKEPGIEPGAGVGATSGDEGGTGATSAANGTTASDKPSTTPTPPPMPSTAPSDGPIAVKPASSEEPAAVTGPTTPGPTTPEPPATPEPTAPVTPVAPAPVSTVAEPQPQPEPEPDPTFATLSVNAVPESVEVEKPFPKVEPMFVLAEVKKRGVEVGIAAGQLEKGKTVHLAVDQTITLVDAATGVTYEITLLSVGAEPDLLFDSGAAGASGASTASTPGSSG